MVANSTMLQVASKRIDFWRDELQAAFRCGDAKRAAECARVLDEYSLLSEEALKIALRRPSTKPTVSA